MEIDILPAQVFEGCNIKGVENAPQTLLDADVLEIFKKYHKVNLLDSFSLNEVNQADAFLADKGIKFKNEIIHMTNTLCEAVCKSISSGHFPITIGGDHSIGTGTIAGSSKACGGKLSVIWFDAHPDINTPESSPSKNFHGMAFGAAMGFGDRDVVNAPYAGAKVSPENCYLLGIRSIDKGEQDMIDSNSIFNFTSDVINSIGAVAAADKIIADINSKGMDRVHFSIDVDVIAPEDMMAVNVPEPRGIAIDDAIIIIKKIVAHPKIQSLDFVEYNPLKDRDGTSLKNCLRMVEAISETLAKK